MQNFKALEPLQSAIDRLQAADARRPTGKPGLTVDVRLPKALAPNVAGMVARLAPQVLANQLGDEIDEAVDAVAGSTAAELVTKLLVAPESGGNRTVGKTKVDRTGQGDADSLALVRWYFLSFCGTFPA